MQIDNQNFHQHKDLILKHIEEAHFIAFDCEFTGLVTQTSNIEGLFPNQQEFYERIKETALNFNLLQLGLTLFHYQNGQYYPKSYNIYVSSSKRKDYNEIFVSEWESMAFLAKNGMNFNRTFKHGVNFKRIFEANQKPIQYKKSSYQTPFKIFFSKKDKQIIEEIEKQIDESSFKIDFKSKQILDFFRTKYDISFDKPKKNMQKYQYVIKIYNHIKSGNQNENVISQCQASTFCDKKEDITFEQKPHANVGLQILIQKIIDCQKPIVGHFPNLDIGLIYHSFIQQLPQKYQQFSNRINQLFPFIFDTKVISRRLQSKIKSINVDLKSLYKACFNKKLLANHANINFKYVQNYLKQDSSHQAGYDSFMTGCAFIAMLNYIYDVQNQPFVLARAHNQNKILYSKFSGEVSLIGPVYSQKGQQFKRKVVIYSLSKQDKLEQQMAQQLSKFGTLTMHEDHGQIYFNFEDYQDISAILSEYKNLKRYEDRFIVKCRKFYT